MSKVACDEMWILSSSVRVHMCIHYIDDMSRLLMLCWSAGCALLSSTLALTFLVLCQEQSGRAGTFAWW
jgi:hypothetical protein